VAAPADQTLATTLRRRREARGDTQEDLAHSAGLTVGSLARIERGHANPSWATVRRMAAALEISLAELGEAVEQAELPSSS
jgi:transcriptional regulator with XRE-family HTH domain